eukprot:sb/3477102/
MEDQLLSGALVTSFFFLEATSTLPAVSHITMIVKIIPRHRTVNIFPDYQNHSCYTRQLKSHKQIEHVYSAMHLYTPHCQPHTPHPHPDIREMEIQRFGLSPSRHIHGIWKE